MRGLADKAFQGGFNVLRLNQRNCGDTEHLSAGLYHSGLTADPIAVVRELVTVDRLDAISVTGYSLGGNLALKLAGDLGTQVPRQLRIGVRHLADGGPSALCGRAGTAAECRLSVEFRAQSQAAGCGGRPKRFQGAFRSTGCHACGRSGTSMSGSRRPTTGSATRRTTTTAPARSA